MTGSASHLDAHYRTPTTGRSGARSTSTRCAANARALVDEARPGRGARGGEGRRGTATARCRPRAPRSMAARRGWVWRWSRRGCGCATQGSTPRILVLSEPPAEAAAAVVAHDLTPVVYTAPGIEALAAAAAALDGTPGRDPDRVPVPVHLKVDTGMHRVGCEPGDAVALAEKIAAHPELRLRRRVHAPRGRRRARERLHRRTARRPSTQCSPSSRERGLRPPRRPRRELGRAARATRRGPLRPRPSRHRALRRTAGAAPGRPRRARVPCSRSRPASRT